MKTKLMASASLLALVLGACSTQEPKPLVQTPEVMYKTAKVNSATSVDVGTGLVTSLAADVATSIKLGKAAAVADVSVTASEFTTLIDIAATSITGT